MYFSLCGRLNSTRKLRVNGLASAAFGGFFIFHILVGATGTGRTTASTALGATCSGFLAASGALTGRTAVQDECGSCDQAGNTETCKDLFQVFDFHNDLLSG